ncbi:MAG: DUF1080 domain-containing protein [Pirellulales bacterium]|nr:DUF1080 domain-containing protein [Pirellulales bacterium]
MPNRSARRIQQGLAIIPVLCLCVFAPRQGMGDELPSIFNGKDLTGWKAPVDNIWWTAKEDVLSVKSGLHKKGSALWTEKEYQNFVMEFEFKFGAPHVDSGIFLRHPNEQIQIGISGSLKRDMTGSPYIGSKRGYPIEAKGVAEVLQLDGWNAMTIVVKGGNYTVWLNGRYVMNYDSDSDIKKGPVGIQLHKGASMAIDFRKIRLAELE